MFLENKYEDKKHAQVVHSCCTPEGGKNYIPVGTEGKSSSR